MKFTHTLHTIAIDITRSELSNIIHCFASLIVADGKFQATHCSTFFLHASSIE